MWSPFNFNMLGRWVLFPWTPNHHHPWSGHVRAAVLFSRYFWVSHGQKRINDYYRLLYGVIITNNHQPSFISIHKHINQSPGWWFQPTPLKNDGVRQWEGWHTIYPYIMENKIHVWNHQQHSSKWLIEIALNVEIAGDMWKNIGVWLLDHSWLLFILAMPGRQMAWCNPNR